MACRISDNRSANYRGRCKPGSQDPKLGWIDSHGGSVDDKECTFGFRPLWSLYRQQRNSAVAQRFCARREVRERPRRLPFEVYLRMAATAGLINELLRPSR